MYQTHQKYNKLTKSNKPKRIYKLYKIQTPFKSQKKHSREQQLSEFQRKY